MCLFILFKKSIIQFRVDIKYNIWILVININQYLVILFFFVTLW
jgi:hypothetical protein